MNTTSFPKIISLRLDWWLPLYLQSDESASTVFGWILFVFLVIVGFRVVVSGIGNLNRGIGKDAYLSLVGGIITIGLALLISSLWLDMFVGWGLFVIFGIFSLVLIGGGIYDFVDVEPGNGIRKIVAGLVFIGVSLTISYFWLGNMTGIVRSIGWLFYVLFGIVGFLAICLGLLILIFGSNAYNKKTGSFIFLAGMAGVTMAFVIGYLYLQLAWLSRVSFWNPFLMLPATTIIIGSILGFVVNLFEDVLYRQGNFPDKSAEWRIVGSSTKYSDATVRDVYDHVHGSGSWAKKRKDFIRFSRMICIVLAAFGPMRLLLFTRMADVYPELEKTINEVNTFSLAWTVGLYVSLLLISGLIGLVFASYSKQSQSA